DWLLVDPDAKPGVGQLIVAHDPRERERLIVKRVIAIEEGALTLASDHLAHGDDRIGPLAESVVVGQPWLRYWPPQRFGRVV
ncbi:MAG: S24/S26 family peptidase, partial [Chloroflexota bacterium]